MKQSTRTCQTHHQCDCLHEKMEILEAKVKAYELESQQLWEKRTQLEEELNAAKTALITSRPAFIPRDPA